MEPLCDLLFELSNEDRLNMLKTIEKKPIKPSDVSKIVGLNPQETHRQLSRLTEKKLIHRSSRGEYILSPYGKQSLEWLSGYEFLSSFQDYFYSHVLSTIPKQLNCRMGELKQCSLIQNLSRVFNNIDMAIREADENIYIITDHMISSNYPKLLEAADRGVSVNVIETGEKNGYEEKHTRRGDENFRKLSNSKYFQRHEIDETPLLLYMSENMVAILSLPTTEMNFDYHGFTTKNKDAIKLCEDIFSFYWKM